MKYLKMYIWTLLLPTDIYRYLHVIYTTKLKPCMEIASKQNPLQTVPLLSTNLQNQKNNQKTPFILFLLKFPNYILYTYEYKSENNL